MPCVRTQHLVLAGIELTIIWAINSADDKFVIFFFFFLLPRKQDLTFDAMETICMKSKSCFLGRMRKKFQNVAC